jgi:heme ABC exporter ATP-binding subunit CcmA
MGWGWMDGHSLTDRENAPTAGGQLSARGVWKSFEGPPVLRDISLEVRSGEVIALLGANGAGKSTLLQLLAGIMRPTRGEVFISGKPVIDPSARRQLGFSGHKSGLYGHLTASENLRFFADLYGIPSRQTGVALELFGLSEYRERPVRLLSRGLVQRLSLARALLHDPRVVLLDEPFTGLDSTAAARFRELVGSLRSRGRSIVITTHILSEAEEIADRSAVLRDGRLVGYEGFQAPPYAGALVSKVVR